jgi:uncharacterized protein (DUF1778 family)
MPSDNTEIEFGTEPSEESEEFDFERVIKLNEEETRWLINILENPPEPSPKLLAAAAKHRPLPRE